MIQYNFMIFIDFCRQMINEQKARLFHWLLFLVLSAIWGSSFILMKEGMKHLTPYQVASLRLLSAGLVLLPFALKAIKRFPRKDFPLVILSGLLGTFFPAYLFCIAETQLDSGLAGILNALTPLFTLLIGAIFFHSVLPLKKWMGVIIGFVGLVLLMISGKHGVSFNNMNYSLFIIMATIFYGLNVNIVSRYLKHIPSLSIAAVAFSVLTIPAGLILFFTGYFHQPLTAGFTYSTGAASILGIFGTAVASILFYMLMKRAGYLFASMVTYGIPFVALFWGFLAHETIMPLQILCLILILAGVWLANK
jgi:drug/metabolite transporter (DMT)-like permease